MGIHLKTGEYTQRRLCPSLVQSFECVWPGRERFVQMLPAYYWVSVHVLVWFLGMKLYDHRCPFCCLGVDHDIMWFSLLLEFSNLMCGFRWYLYAQIYIYLVEHRFRLVHKNLMYFSFEPFILSDIFLLLL
jgi:hypothetical protein